MVEPETPETIHLWGGALCLDFANSVDWSQDDAHVAPDRTDVLRTPDQLARWGRRMGLGAAAAPDDAELASVRALRDAVYRIFAAIARGRAPAADDLAALAAAHAEGASAGR